MKQNSVEKRSARRAVLLSRIDQERLARGEIALPEEAVHESEPQLPQPRSVTQKAAQPCTQLVAQNGVQKSTRVGKERVFSPREQEILAQVPPHFGKI